LLRKEDYAMLSGEYFLTEQQKKEQAGEKKREQKLLKK
jgi:hypothetical protein